MKSIPQKNIIEEGIFLAYKPTGITSFGFLGSLRRIFRIRKIGHAGTLDPLAEGLMIVGYSKGTKKLAQYIKLDKVYVAEFLLGIQTRSGDLEGKIIYKQDVPILEPSFLQSILHNMKGEHSIPVPLYSAVKVSGRPLYEYARRGLIPPLIPEKEMKIFDIEYMDSYVEGNFFVVRVRIHVSSGTYIRTLAEEFGKRLNLPATLKSLVRINIGPFSINSAFRISPFKKNFYGILNTLLKKIYLSWISFLKRAYNSLK